MRNFISSIGSTFSLLELAERRNNALPVERMRSFETWFKKSSFFSYIAGNISRINRPIVQSIAKRITNIYLLVRMYVYACTYSYMYASTKRKHENTKTRFRSFFNRSIFSSFFYQVGTRNCQKIVH